MNRPMRAIVLQWLLVGGCVASASAQDDAAPGADVVSIMDRPGFVEAVGQIAQGHEAEGLAALAPFFERYASDPDLYRLHFNVACGQARLQQLADHGNLWRVAELSVHGP